jgi:DNA helicase-2/ATP-dependent DNA helicase PcrA
MPGKSIYIAYLLNILSICYTVKMTYLDGLNERQKEAVLTIDGPVSVLAGAGSGKTTVLTTRIYHLIRQGVAPDAILAVTFTNKAAREMRERVAKRLDTTGALPFVATFHGLGREILQQYGESLGIPRFFTIFDRDDSEKAIKDALKALDVDPKELSPRFVLSRISKAKGDGMTAQQFADKHGRESFRSRIVSECWKRYEEALKKEKALDFDDLIALPVRLLETNEQVRRIVQNRFSHIHIDEYQDTNALQGRLAAALAGETSNLFVVGDIDQCLIAGTKILMASGSEKNIEDLAIGEEVLSNYGSGNIRPARISSFVEKKSRKLVKITTDKGSVLTSTSEHTHFAGYKLGITPQLYFTYLMRKNGVGWRIGVSQTYTKGIRKPMIGFQQRCNQEHADAVWVIGVYNSPNEARVAEYKFSLTYAIPTLPFVARKGSRGGYVHDQEIISSIFASFDTETSAKQLLSDLGLSSTFPHHRAQATKSDRRNIRVTLCGDHRGVTPMHRISLAGNDSEGRGKLLTAGFSVRRAKIGSTAWRFETSHKNRGDVQTIAEKLLEIFPDAQIVENARLGGGKTNPKDGNSLPLIPAASIQRGMAVFDAKGGYEIVTKIEKYDSEVQKVFDIDIENTHNFIANGIATHNCIYTWRGATIDNLLAFEDAYPGAKTIILEHNYRSTKTIVDASNSIIELNKNRKEKRSVTNNPDGEKIVVHPENTAEREGRYIAHEAKRLIREGTIPEEIAVLFRTNFQSRVLEEAFLQAGVPYRLLGTRFFDRKEVKDVLAWIRLALDPSRENDRARAVQTPPRGIGKVTLGKMIAGKEEDYKPSERAKIDAFKAVVTTLASAAETEMPSLFVRMIIEKSGIETLLASGGEDDQERLENVKELATLATRYDGMPGKEGISMLLTDASLASDQDELDNKQKTNGVTLMTVHAAKGLEFDTVFVTGLEEGLFPHQGMDSEKRDEEEERRLFYVAITRAKKRLFLTFARIRRIYGTDYLSEPSNFLRDLDPMLTNYTDPSGYDEYEEIIEA